MLTGIIAQEQTGVLFFQLNLDLSSVSVRNTGFLRSLEKYGKMFGHFPTWKSLEKNFFRSVSMEKNLIFWRAC